MPRIRVFAGPDGSGKTTAARAIGIIGEYINIDEIEIEKDCSSAEAARLAVKRKEELMSSGRDFTYEAVMTTKSSIRNLEAAKDKGYYIESVCVITASPDLNVLRVEGRQADGGKGIDAVIVKNRYYLSLANIARLAEICDTCYIYDNTEKPQKIFKKENEVYYYYDNKYWSKEGIKGLVGANE